MFYKQYIFTYLFKYNHSPDTIYMKKEMEKISPEVLIYIQNLKNYLNTDEKARTYFINNKDETYFYDEVIKVSQENYNQTGQPILTYEQFENIRKTIFNESNKNQPKITYEKYEEYMPFGKFYLN